MAAATATWFEGQQRYRLAPSGDGAKEAFAGISAVEGPGVGHRHEDQKPSREIERGQQEKICAAALRAE